MHSGRIGIEGFKLFIKGTINKYDDLFLGLVYKPKRTQKKTGEREIGGKQSIENRA